MKRKNQHQPKIFTNNANTRYSTYCGLQMGWLINVSFFFTSKPFRFDFSLFSVCFFLVSCKYKLVFFDNLLLRLRIVCRCIEMFCRCTRLVSTWLARNRQFVTEVVPNEAWVASLSQVHISRQRCYVCVCTFAHKIIMQTISVGQAEAAIQRRVRNSKRLGWLREIRHYQKTVDPIIPRTSFQRLVKEISQDYKISSELHFYH